MDNPNSSGRLRRHNSLPSKFQGHSLGSPSQRRLKSNPYIGSFRHSPPTTFRSAAAFKELPAVFSSAPSLLRSSPYIGWFRHAPPASFQSNKIYGKNLSLLDRYHYDRYLFRTPKDGTLQLAEFITGKLRGGGKDHSMKSIDHSEIFRCAHRALQESSNESSSGTIKMLARLGSWFLFPLAYDQESAGYKMFDHRDTSTISEDAASCCSSDDDGSCQDEQHSETDSDYDESSMELSDFEKSSQGYSEHPLSVSVSNVAEAYYAHQAIERVEDFSPHRLDYEISQVDITRMARNASRHLDVESILTLPTITYHRSPSFQCTEINEEKGFSFVMVQDVPPVQNATNSSVTEQDNFCVICMEQFLEGDRLRVLPCDHAFHVGCIDRWLSGSHSHFECFTSGCPTCKKRPLEVGVSNQNDGSVPSWAFAQLGDALARSLSPPLS